MSETETPAKLALDTEADLVEWALNRLVLMPASAIIVFNHLAIELVVTG